MGLQKEMLHLKDDSFRRNESRFGLAMDTKFQIAFEQTRKEDWQFDCSKMLIRRTTENEAGTRCVPDIRLNIAPRPPPGGP
jgi:hypothetical protein